jgi:hypothetical protein
MKHHDLSRSAAVGIGASKLPNRVTSTDNECARGISTYVRALRTRQQLKYFLRGQELI